MKKMNKKEKFIEKFSIIIVCQSDKPLKKCLQRKKLYILKEKKLSSSYI